MRPRPGILLVALWGLALVVASEAAQEHEQEESPSVLTLRTSVKATGLISRAPDAPDLFSERTTAQSMVRFRIEPEIRAGRNTTFNVAYEQRLHYASGASGIAAIGILPVRGLNAVSG